MEWLILMFLALAGWIWWQQTRRIEALTQRLAAVEQRLAEVLAGAPAQPPSLDDVLVLDTPVPVASNDEAEAGPPAEADVLVLTEALSPESAHQSEIDEDILVLSEPLPPIPEAARPAPPPRVRERKLDQWLAENGLAWMGGGAFALGGIMLVAIAVQQSWFTPLVRLYCALGLGVGLIAASEWLRRRAGAHVLVAALLAGAGVATFYATAWGAHALYNYIDASAATLALAVCAILLLALSFIHGQALGVLAVLAAFMAPALTNPSDWAPLGLTLFLGAVAAAGFGAAALQRWAWVGAVTLFGLYFWFAAAIGDDQIRRALALASFASLGGVALAFRKPIDEEEGGTLTWARARALAPSVAVCISSIGLIWTWLSVAAAEDGVVSAPAWVGAMFVGLAAASVRARVAPAAVVTVAIGALVAGFVLYQAARFHPLEASFYPFILFSAFVVVASGIGARPHRRDRAQIALASGIGAALLTALGAFTAPDWHGPMAYVALFAGAVALLGAATVQARTVLAPNASLAVDGWTCAAAALALLGAESLFVTDVRTAGVASLALGFAAAFAWKQWRALGWSALAAAALALAHAFLDGVAQANLSGAMPIANALAVLGLAAGFLFGGAYLCAQRTSPSTTGEALGAAGAILVLLGAFLGLRWIAAGGAGAPLDAFTESALQGLTFFAAGHITLQRPAQELGRIGAMRGHVLMALGFLAIALANGLMLNPWWGPQPGVITGPPIFNALALAFAAPAAGMLLAARRLYTRQRNPARLYAIGGVLFALVWAILETRRAFHGVDMSGAPVGPVEGASYGLVFLMTATIGALLARVRSGIVGDDLQRARPAVAWAGMVVGGWLMLVALQVWWANGANGPMTGLWLWLELVATTSLALVLGRLLSIAPGFDPTRFAAATLACLFAWTSGHTLIAWIVARGYAPLESFAHALWPLVFVLGGAAITARAPGRDTVRHYLYDLQSIWANAAWPANAAGALGLWLAFNPWWGMWPADARTIGVAFVAIALCALAAWMTLAAVRVPHVRYPAWFAPASRVIAVGHLFVLITLIVRATFNDGALAPGIADGAELWTYSAVWALFGAGALAYGAIRDDAVLRWVGLAILFATAAKVFVFDTARLSGIIRVASLLGLAAVATLTALGMRRHRARAP